MSEELLRLEHLSIDYKVKEMCIRDSSTISPAYMMPILSAISATKPKLWVISIIAVLYLSFSSFMMLRI